MAFNRSGFKNKNKKNSAPLSANPEAPIRVRTPRGKEVLGIVEQRVGGNRMLVKCFDGKTRNCRIPGRLRRKLWIREGDKVLVEPIEFEEDTKGQLFFKYTPAQIQLLQKKGFLEKIENEF